MQQHDQTKGPRTHQGPAANGETLTPDQLLFRTGTVPKTCDFHGIFPVVSRVFVRLMVDDAAFEAHLGRLNASAEKNADLHPDNFIEDPEGIYLGGPPDECPTAGSITCMLMMTDRVNLRKLRGWIHNDPSAFWKTQMAAPREPFAAGDRDDRLAQKILELAFTAVPLDGGPWFERWGIKL